MPSPCPATPGPTANPGSTRAGASPTICPGLASTTGGTPRPRQAGGASGHHRISPMRSAKRSMTTQHAPPPTPPPNYAATRLSQPPRRQGRGVGRLRHPARRRQSTRQPVPAQGRRRLRPRRPRTVRTNPPTNPRRGRSPDIGAAAGHGRAHRRPDHREHPRIGHQPHHPHGNGGPPPPSSAANSPSHRSTHRRQPPSPRWAAIGGSNALATGHPPGTDRLRSGHGRLPHAMVTSHTGRTRRRIGAEATPPPAKHQRLRDLTTRPMTAPVEGKPEPWSRRSVTRTLMPN
jgi:hypothetical protein